MSGPPVGVLVSGDLGGLEKWASRNLVKFNKCKALPLGRNKPRHQHRLGPPARKQLGRGGPGGHQVDHEPRWPRVSAAA